MKESTSCSVKRKHDRFGLCTVFWWCIQSLRRASNTLCVAPGSAGSGLEHSRKMMKACQKCTFLGSFSSSLHHLMWSSDVLNQEVALNVFSRRWNQCPAIACTVGVTSGCSCHTFLGYRGRMCGKVVDYHWKGNCSAVSEQNLFYIVQNE